MKIVKPMTLGLLQRPYLYRGQHRLAIAALGFFRLGEGSADRFLTENLQWAKLIPDLPLGLPLDHVLPKARAEVMLSGKAYAPSPAATHMTVRLQCAGIDKRLQITGPRRWRRILGAWLCIDAAQPFEQMSLTWENAYGGSGHAANPLGRGYLRGFDLLRHRQGMMPTIVPLDCTSSPGPRARAPAGFAPMGLLHSAARLRSGTYDQRWLEEDFPGLPRDFDFGVFNLAPPDQQRLDRFRGDEAYVLEGMHRSHATLAGTLPGLRARAFAQRRGQAPGQAEEIGLHCDTVWFFPEHDIGLLVYRGEMAVSDSDALDVDSLMIAYERCGDAPRPLEHYREVLSLRLDARTAGLHAFNEGQLAPPRTPAQLAARSAARAAAAAEIRVRKQAMLDERMAEFWQASGFARPADNAQALLPPSLLNGPDADEIAEGEFDLVELHAQAQALAAAAQRDGADAIAAAERMLAEQVNAPGLAAVTQQALERAAVAAPDLLGEKSLPAAAFDEMLAGIDDAEHCTAVAQALAQTPALRRAARNASPVATPQGDLPDAAALALRRFVERCLRDGVPLAGRDLAGACLRDLDLRGQDLREVQLERADLRNARLVGAKLGKATLTGADLCHADFSDADLDGANLCATQAHGARFRNATLRGVRALDADWSGADLGGAVLEDVLATGIQLAGARLDDSSFMRCVISDGAAAESTWLHAQWHSCIATGIDLGNSSLVHAEIEKSVLMDAALAGTNWQDARLANVYAGGKADWSGAQLGRAHFSRCNLHGARLSGASLSDGVFAQCDFGETDLCDAMLDGARLYRSLFMRARLRRVQARRADFFQALCRKADFSDADLSQAALVQADTSEAEWRGAKLDGARMAQKARLA